jgi:hypothetical protein
MIVVTLPSIYLSIIYQSSHRRDRLVILKRISLLPTSDSLGDLKRDLQQLEQSNWSCVSAGTSPFCGQGNGTCILENKSKSTATNSHSLTPRATSFCSQAGSLGGVTSFCQLVGRRVSMYQSNESQKGCLIKDDSSHIAQYLFINYLSKQSSP